MSSIEPVLHSVYNSPSGFCGSILSDVGPILYCMDDTKPDGSHPAIMGFIMADKSREMCSLTKEER